MQYRVTVLPPQNRISQRRRARICRHCAYPEPCRFPQQAYGSMEGYGLFVTQVCRGNGLPYHHGDKTITYSACVLF